MTGRISDLAAQTGADLAAGDLLELVDVSDTSLAATGTNEKITADELAKGLATTLGVVGRDKIWDSAGDVLIGTGADAGARLAIGSAAGKALVADPHATNKASINFPHGVEEALRGTASTSLGTTIDRGVLVEGNFAALSTGRLTIVRICFPKGLPITNISFWSATTALSVGVNQWFSVFDLSLNKLAVTADDTNTAWAANTKKTLTVASGPFVTTYAGLHYLGVMVKATTVPTLIAQVAAVVGVRAGSGTTFLCAAADSSLTNPASCPSTAGVSGSIGGTVYAEVS